MEYSTSFSLCSSVLVVTEVCVCVCVCLGMVLFVPLFLLWFNQACWSPHWRIEMHLMQAEECITSMCLACRLVVSLSSLVILPISKLGQPPNPPPPSISTCASTASSLLG